MSDAELIELAWKFAVGVLILAAWTYVVLDQRDLRRALRRQRTQLHQYRRAIVQLQGAAVRPPTSVGQPMPTIGRAPQPRLHSAPGNASQGPQTCIADPDRTLRLARPPALGDVEAAMAKASRALTPTELAARLDRQPWDLIADIDRLERAGRIVAVPSHTAGRTAYQLADSTERMPRGMSLLPGATR